MAQYRCINADDSTLTAGAIYEGERSENGRGSFIRLSDGAKATTRDVTLTVGAKATTRDVTLTVGELVALRAVVRRCLTPGEETPAMNLDALQRALRKLEAS